MTCPRCRTRRDLSALREVEESDDCCVAAVVALMRHYIDCRGSAASQDVLLQAATASLFPCLRECSSHDEILARLQLCCSTAAPEATRATAPRELTELLSQCCASSTCVDHMLSSVHGNTFAPCTWKLCSSAREAGTTLGVLSGPSLVPVCSPAVAAAIIRCLSVVTRAEKSRAAAVDELDTYACMCFACLIQPVSYLKAA